MGYQFSDPYGICTDGRGRVLVADYSNNRVQVFTADGIFVTSISCNGGPYDVAVDNTGNIHVAETNKIILKKQGTFFAFALMSSLGPSLYCCKEMMKRTSQQTSHSLSYYHPHTSHTHSMNILVVSNQIVPVNKSFSFLVVKLQ